MPTDLISSATRGGLARVFLGSKRPTSGARSRPAFSPSWWIRKCAAAAAILSALGIAAAAAAQGVGIPPIERKFPDGSKVRFYGQINKGVLQYDDGRNSETYGLIDNDNSNTRFGLTYSRAFGRWDFENVNEFQYAPFSTADINILQQTPTADDWNFDSDDIRKIDFSLGHESYGKFSVGQGSMATDGVAEVDLSGTKVIGYSEIEDTAGGQLFRFSGPGLSFDDSISEITVSDAFSNFDGVRRVRIRYDTPDLNGFGAAFAYGRDLLSDNQEDRDEDLFDVALRYANEVDAFEVEAAVGYFWDADHTSTWSGSASVLHRPTGLNATAAAGSQESGEVTGTYWYGKIGLLKEFVSWGDTGVALDYYSGKDIAAPDSDSFSWGLMLVQNIDRANIELWLTYRDYQYDDQVADYEDGTAIFGGARFRF